MNRPGPAYVVYPPPTKEFPFLSVTLMPDGTVIARRFDTEDEAIAYNKQIAGSLYAGEPKH